MNDGQLMEIVAFSAADGPTEIGRLTMSNSFMYLVECKGSSKLPIEVEIVVTTPRVVSGYDIINFMSCHYACRCDLAYLLATKLDEDGTEVFASDVDAIEETETLQNNIMKDML